MAFSLVGLTLQRACQRQVTNAKPSIAGSCRDIRIRPLAKSVRCPDLDPVAGRATSTPV